MHDKIEFEDKNEQFGFTQIPNVVLTSTILNPTEKCIYAILRRYASMPNGAMPSVPTICLEAGISKATYNRAIKKFVKSTDNPAPKIPLITAIHRKNQTNLYKIHKLTDSLINQLKHAMMLSKEERNEIKSKYRKQNRKSTSQNETSTENTRESQFETPRRLKMRPLDVSNCDTSNIELSNIDNNKQEPKKHVVVVQDQEAKEKNKKRIINTPEVVESFKEKFKKVGKEELSHQKVDELVSLAEEHHKNLVECLKNTVLYFQAIKTKPQNKIGALRYAITHGWDVPDLQKISQPKQASRTYDQVDPSVEKYRRILKEQGYEGGYIS